MSGAYLPGATCAAANALVLEKALTEYFADRQRWVTDPKTGRMTRRARNHIGVCSCCGSPLEAHFRCRAPLREIGPGDAQYEAVRALVVEGYRQGTGGPENWDVLALCPEALNRTRSIGIHPGPTGRDHLLNISSAAFIAAEEIVREERRRRHAEDAEPAAPERPKVAARDSLKKPN